MVKINVLLSISILGLTFTNAQEEEAGHMTSSNGSMDQYFVEDSSPEDTKDDSKDATSTAIPTTGEQLSTEETILITTNTEATPTKIDTETSTSSLETTTTHTTPTTTHTTPTTITSSSETRTACGTAWDQCGGADFHGPNCCQPGFACLAANDYWARCVPTSISRVSSILSRKSMAHSSRINNGAVLRPSNFVPVAQLAAAVAFLL